MTLEDLGNLGELVSALAVVISLVYLAIQIRQNTVQMREGSKISKLLLQENFVSGQERITAALLASEEMYRVWRLGSTASDELSDDDRERFGLWLYGEMYRYHLMYRASAVEPMEHERTLIQIDRLAGWHAFQSWWSRQRAGFSFDLEFIELVDDRIKRAQIEQG